jgi:hypothetical protein
MAMAALRVARPATGRGGQGVRFTEHGILSLWQ